MSISQTRPVRLGLRSGWAPLLRTHRWFIVAELLILIAALILVVIVKGHPGPLPGDVRLTLDWQRLVRPHRLPTWLLEADSTINWPIPAGIGATIIVAAFALSRRYLDIVVALGTMAAATSTNFLTSRFVQRPRPAGFGIYVHQQIAHVYSFPSGHVEHALAFFGIVIFLTFQVQRLTPRLAVALWLVRLYLLGQIILMPFSRVVEGEHWPSDNLAGLLYGGFWLLVGIHAYRWAAPRWPHLTSLNEGEE